MPEKPQAIVDYPVLPFADAAAWEMWLEQNHGTERGIWLQFAKVASGIPSVTRAQALDVALCYGWIDGQAKSQDAQTYLQKFTPRGKRSIWSKRNREHVERLISAGRMRSAGHAAIEAAKADGRWDRAYDSPGTATVPADLQAALDANPDAKACFEALKGINRYAILHRVQTAVKPETRARRIAGFIDQLSRGEKLHP